MSDKNHDMHLGVEGKTAFSLTEEPAEYKGYTQTIVISLG